MKGGGGGLAKAGREPPSPAAQSLASPSGRLVTGRPDGKETAAGRACGTAYAL